MNISQSFQNALDAVVAFIPRAIAFAAILIIGWIVGRLLQKLVAKLLVRAGFDKAADRGGLRRFTGRYTASQMTGLIVFYAVMLFTLQLAFGAFGNNPVSTLLNDIVAWLPQLFIALVIIVVAMAVANVVYDLVSNALAAVSYGRTIASVARVGIIIIAAIAALNQVGIGATVTMPLFITALAIIAGVAIVGVGGGLIGPMRERWERTLGRMEEESTNLRASVRGHHGPPNFEQEGHRQSNYQQGTYTEEYQAQQEPQEPQQGYGAQQAGQEAAHQHDRPQVSHGDNPPPPSGQGPALFAASTNERPPRAAFRVSGAPGVGDCRATASRSRARRYWGLRCSGARSARRASRRAALVRRISSTVAASAAFFDFQKNSVRTIPTTPAIIRITPVACREIQSGLLFTANARIAPRTRRKMLPPIPMSRPLSPVRPGYSRRALWNTPRTGPAEPTSVKVRPERMRG